MLANVRTAMELVLKVAKLSPLELPKLKEFKPKMGLPKLSSYKGNAPVGYWKSWPKRTFEQMLPTKSWVSSTKLKELALNYSYSDWDRLERVCHRLENGADIGCTGRARLPTVCTNASSALEYGDRVADGLAEMIEKGLIVGPLDEEEIPWKDITVSAIMVRLKPNGKARIIVNLSIKQGQLESMLVSRLMILRPKCHQQRNSLSLSSELVEERLSVRRTGIALTSTRWSNKRI